MGIHVGVSILATWFGPVSVFRPTMLSSILLCNLIILGFLMKREKFGKNTKVATYVICVAVVLLPIVGPGAQEGQNVMERLTRPASLAVIAVESAVFVVTTILMFLPGFQKRSQGFIAACLLGLTIPASGLAGTLSKAIAALDGSAQIVVILAYTLLDGHLDF